MFEIRTNNDIDLDCHAMTCQDRSCFYELRGRVGACAEEHLDPRPGQKAYLILHSVTVMCLNIGKYTGQAIIFRL